jgi:hypothetical protein
MITKKQLKEKGELTVPVTIIKKHGYEYHLVSVERPKMLGIEEPCFMGHKGYALKSICKIKKDVEN